MTVEPRWRRVFFYDENGNEYTSTNPVPVTMTDGTNEFTIVTEHLAPSKDERDDAIVVASGNYGYKADEVVGSKMTPLITDQDDGSVAPGQIPQLTIGEMHYYDWKSQSWRRWEGDDGYVWTYITNFPETYYQDDSVFTIEVDEGVAIGGVVTTDNVNAGDFGVFRITTDRSLVTTINNTTYVDDDDAVSPGNETMSNITLNYGYEEVTGDWKRQVVNKHGQQEVSTRFADTGNIDAFGRLRVSNPETIFDSKNIFDDPNIGAAEENQSLFFDNQETSGTGTTTLYDNDTASQALSVSATTAGTRVRQTKQRFNYQPGKSMLIFMTFVFDNGQTGITQKEGMFDDKNGLFLQDDEGTLSFVRRTYVAGSSTDNVVTQDSWNIDKFDGTGKSGITLDLTKTNILTFDYEWLGVGRVRMGFVIDGLIYYCHEFLNANNLTEVYMSTPNLPLRSEISNDGTGAAASMLQICSTVISEGGQNPLGSVRSINTAGTHLDANTENTTYALIGIRLHPNYIEEVVEVLNAALQIQTGDHRLLWELRFNPTVAGTFTYTTQLQSAIQYALGVTANTITGGYIIASGFVESGGQQSGNVGSTQANVTNALKLGTLIDGTPDEIVLCVTPIGGSTNVDVEGAIK